MPFAGSAIFCRLRAVGAVHTADRAFQLLARTSMHTNRKVRDVADHLARTGELLMK